MAVVTGATLGAAAAMSMGWGATSSALLAGVAGAGLGGAIGKGVEYAADEMKGMMEGPEIPDPPTPDAPVEAGDEGIRKGEMNRQSRRRALGNEYLTRGQDRATGATLGGMRETLG